MTIYDDQGNSCETGHINSGQNDWKKERCKKYYGSDIGDCNQWIYQAYVDGRQITKVKVTHSKHNGVNIVGWDLCVGTDNPGWHCDDGHWYDDDDSHELTCIFDESLGSCHAT